MQQSGKIVNVYYETIDTRERREFSGTPQSIFSCASGM